MAAERAAEQQGVKWKGKVCNMTMGKDMVAPAHTIGRCVPPGARALTDLPRPVGLADVTAVYGDDTPAVEEAVDPHPLAVDTEDAAGHCRGEQVDWERREQVPHEVAPPDIRVASVSEGYVFDVRLDKRSELGAPEVSRSELEGDFDEEAQVDEVLNYQLRGGQLEGDPFNARDLEGQLQWDVDLLVGGEIEKHLVEEAAAREAGVGRRQ